MRSPETVAALIHNAIDQLAEYLYEANDLGLDVTLHITLDGIRVSRVCFNSDNFGLHATIIQVVHFPKPEARPNGGGTPASE